MHRKEGHAKTEAGRNDAAISQDQREPGATKSWKRQGKILPQGLEKERGPAHALISDFQPPDLAKNIFLPVVLSYQVCGTLLWQP